MSSGLNPTAKRRHEKLAADRSIPLGRPLIGVVSALIAYALFQALARTPELSEVILGSGRGTIPARLLSAFTGSVPWSVAEIAAGAYLLWLAALAGLALRQSIRGHRRFRNALAGGLARGIRDAGLLVAIGYLVWGFNYARVPFDRRAGWPAWSGVESAELRLLTERAVGYANTTYVTLHESEDALAPTPAPENPTLLLAGIEDGWRAVGFLFPKEAPAVAGSFGLVKRPHSSPLIARLGVSGVFMPLTAEPHVLKGMPAVGSVQAMAHEQAHQRGFANEAEASFMGFLANSHSPEPVARYSSAVFAARQLLAAFRRTDPEAAGAVAERLHPGVYRDLADLDAFWKPYRGVGQKVGSAVNDRYLRANRVSGGVASYGRVVRLLVELQRQTGALFPE